MYSTFGISHQSNLRTLLAPLQPESHALTLQPDLLHRTDAAHQRRIYKTPEVVPYELTFSCR